MDRKLFTKQRRCCALIGMIHLKALPATPASRLKLVDILDAALRDGENLVLGDCDALLVENMSDLPYCRARVGPEITASMAIVVDHVKRAFAKPVGVQVLAAANIEAMAVAACGGADFIRAEAFAYAHVADEGLLNASAAEVLRYRRQLDAERVSVWADVQKKHAAHAITGDLSLGDLAHGFSFCGADALIATGIATGSAASVKDVIALKSAKLPVVVGSGIDIQNVTEFAAIADGLIVGSSIKIDGDWKNPVDKARVAALAKAIDALEQGSAH
ncbi:MAG: BtpA/SgcQ family protein [Bradymonadales bacterium]|jgi:membrane complex biogenesis BtpA family protein